MSTMASQVTRWSRQAARIKTLGKLAQEVAHANQCLHTESLVPTKMDINLTGRCNLRCVYCERHTHPSRTEIPFDTLKSLLDFARRHQTRVLFSGGEPFLYSRIWDILHYCEVIGLRVSVVTNGTLLGKLTAQQQRLLNNTLSLMSISFDAPQAEQHDQMRGVTGAFKAACAYLGQPERQHLLGINVVMLPDFQNVLPMIDFAAGHNVSVNFLPVIFSSNYPELPAAAWKESLPDKLKLHAERCGHLNHAISYAKKKGVATSLPLITFYIHQYYMSAASRQLYMDRLMRNFLCFVPLTMLVINEHGHIGTCAFVKGTRTLADGDVLANWRATALEFRRFWLKGGRFPQCHSCACHCLTNIRGNLFTHPLANLRHARWALNYLLNR